MKKTILIIDDDMHIGNMIEEALRIEGYDVLRAYSGTEALLVLNGSTPDLILLDLMLPGLSGEELLPRIKDIPVIVVSAKPSIEDKVSLLLNGASDYITKPFDVQELLARIVVQLRLKDAASREGTPAEENISVGDITLIPDLLCIKVNGEEISLTRTECAILRLLMANAGRPIGRNTILERIADDTPDCTERSLKQHVSNIRKKIMGAGGDDPIEAVYGIGFKFKK